MHKQELLTLYTSTALEQRAFAFVAAGKTAKLVSGSTMALNGVLLHGCDSVSFKFVDTKTGTAQIALPNSWKELLCVVSYGAQILSTMFPSAPFTSEKNVSLGSYGTSFATGKISSTKAQLSGLNWGGTDKTAEASFSVYYR